MRHVQSSAYRQSILPNVLLVTITEIEPDQNRLQVAKHSDTFLRLRQEDSMFEACLGYIMSFRSTWATWQAPDSWGIAWWWHIYIVCRRPWVSKTPKQHKKSSSKSWTWNLGSGRSWLCWKPWKLSCLAAPPGPATIAWNRKQSKSISLKWFVSDVLVQWWKLHLKQKMIPLELAFLWQAQLTNPPILDVEWILSMPCPDSLDMHACNPAIQSECWLLIAQTYSLLLKLPSIKCVSTRSEGYVFWLREDPIF